MRKHIAALAAITLLLAPQASLLAVDTSGAVGYLTAHNSSPWTVMGLIAAGADPGSLDFLKSISATSAIQYEAPILAITSAGHNPHTFASSDLVEQLKGYHAAGQLGDPTTLNDDIFGILALISAGLASSDPVVDDSKTFILAHQNSDGGWGFTTTGSSDTNSTASAITALVAAGISKSDNHITDAADYLHGAQNDDGGFPYDPTSSFGTASDSSSTACVIWAMNALSINDVSWSKSGHTPGEFLQSTQAPNGYFEYQSGSGEDSFSAITTAYAAIALAGKTLPLRVATAQADQFDFRIEGSTEQVCAGRTEGPTALDVVKNAVAQCGYSYHITDTSFGPYLDQIGSDQAAGLIGWLYLVNFTAPAVGAADYTLKTGDSITWYYGDYQWLPTRLSVAQAEVATSGSVQASVETFQNNVWQALAGAVVFYGAQSTITDASGHASFSPADAYYKVFSEKQGYIRSNQVLVKVGTPDSASVNLSVTVDAGSVLGDTTPPDTIAFTVTPANIEFGTLIPGASAQKTVTITNTGSAGIHMEGVVTGDGLFVDSLWVDGMIWRKFKAELASAEQQQHQLKLAVPSSYSVSGAKSGKITFWAIAN